MGDSQSRHSESIVKSLAKVRNGVGRRAIRIQDQVNSKPGQQWRSDTEYKQDTETAEDQSA